MGFGIAELITLLLGLQGFGLQANPKAPTPDASLQYAIADADVVGHFDALSVIPSNYKVLTELPNQPAIKANPELAKTVRKLINEVDGPRNFAKGTIGLDPVTDINDATAFFQIVPKHDPNFVIAVHGKFSMTMIDKIAKLNNKASVKVGAGAFVDSGDGPAVGLTKDGVMLVGTPALVKERVADTWKTPPHGAGTNLGAAADVLAQHPVFAFVLTMSPTARAEALKNMPPTPNFASDMIKRHKMAAFSVYTDGIGWQWADSTAAGLEAMAQISDGFADLLRAAAIAPRGFGKIVLGALESYRGANKQLDQVIARKADIQKIIESYTGDGSFKTKIDKDTKALKLNVRLTGKSVSEVIPFGIALPGAAVFMLTVRKKPDSDAMPPPVMMPAPAPAPVQPAPRK